MSVCWRLLTPTNGWMDGWMDEAEIGQVNIYRIRSKWFVLHNVEPRFFPIVESVDYGWENEENKGAGGWMNGWILNSCLKGTNERTNDVYAW